MSHMVLSNLRLPVAFGFFALVLPASIAAAANSFSNSLTGFTGDSTQAPTVSAVAAAGFNFSNDGVGTSGPPPATVYQVQFDSSGAIFGIGQPVNEGRNFM